MTFGRHGTSFNDGVGATAGNAVRRKTVTDERPFSVPAELFGCASLGYRGGVGFARLWFILAWLAAMVGCRGTTEERRSLEFWTLGREGEVVARMLPEFERSRGVRVRLQQIPWSAAHEKLLTAYVGESMPDVFQVGNTWVPEFVALGAVAALDGRIAASSAVRRGDYFEGIFDTNVVEGATWALPWYVDTRLLFYRTDLLASAGYSQPPRTWAEWLDAMTRLRSRGAGYGILLPLNEWQPLVIFALQLGADMLRDGERFGNFRSPAFRKAFDFYLDLFRRDLAPKSGAAQISNLYQEFARGYFAFTITGPWNLGEFARRLPVEHANDWSTAPMPAPDGQYPGTSVAGGSSLALFRGSPRHEDAWALVEYLSAPERQIELHSLTGDLPARKSAWTAGSLARDRRAAAFWTQLGHVRASPKIPEWERIADKIMDYAEEAVRGRRNADEALEALDEEVDAVLEKRRWLLGKRVAP